MNLGQLIKRKRESMDLSLRDFAELCGLSHSYLSNLEKGISPRNGKPVSPTIETLTKIADGLKVPLQVLMLTAGYYHEQLQQNAISSEEKIFRPPSLHDKIDLLPEEKRKLLETITDSFLRETKPPSEDENAAAGE